MDGPPPEEEDFSVISIQDRLSHKNWKARVSAYEALVKTFQTTASDTDPAFKPYTNNPELLKKAVTDSNAVAQERGVECVVAFVKYAGETAARTREVVMPAVVDKCFGSSRAGTKAHAVELALQYVEVENGGAGVVGDILPGLSAKQPKAVAGCVLALKEIFRVFGTQTTPPPPVLKALPKIFSHTDKTVRAEGTQLVHIFYQYIGAGIEPWLADLKPVQVKELKEAFEGLEKDGKGKGSLKVERMTREQAREAEARGGDDDGAEVNAEPEEPEELDPRAFAEPVNIAPKLPSNMSLLTSSKWKERKEVLDELFTLLDATPRIVDVPEMTDVARSLAVRIQSDANVNCVMVAANCLEALAKGMTASFARMREMVVPPVLERLKERKAAVTDTIGAALDAVFASTTLPDIVPDLAAALTSKNPQVKEGTLKFLCRCLSTATTPLSPPQIKPMSETLITLLEDTFEGTRNEAANCMGTLMKMVGERPLNGVIEPLADTRKAKIKEAFEKATVKAKVGAAAPPKKAAPAPAAAPPKKKPAGASKPAPSAAAADEESTPPPPKKPAAKPAVVAKPPAPKPGAAAAPKKPAASGASKSAKTAAPAAGSLDTFKYRFNPEDAESMASEAIPASILTGLGDANWKTRIIALEEMATWLEEGAVDTVEAEIIVRALAKKGWSEKNFQVSSKIFGVFTFLSEKSPTFGRASIALAVGHLTEKLGDLKLKKPAGDTLFAFAEKTSLQFVLSQAYDPLAKQKAPKVLADATLWVNSALTEFGIAGLALKTLIEFLKAGLQNSNAAVRTSATKTLVTLKLFAGSSIKDLLEDLNPQLLNTITTEFEKAEGTPAPEPTRTSADLANIPVAGSAAGPAAGGDAMDDLFPRVELDGLLKGTSILADAKSEAWKTKKEALESLQATLDQGSNKRLTPNMGEIAQVLKARVTDANKAVQSLALDIVSRIATGMGKPFERHNRHFVQAVTTVLSDQKAPVRASAILTLSAIADACEGLDSMVPYISTGLTTQNPQQKGSLLTWIADRFKDDDGTLGLELSSWVAPIVTSLDDRSGDVRKGAQALLPALIKYAGYDQVLKATEALKPASRSSAMPLIQAARPQAKPAPPPPAPAAKPPPKAARIPTPPPTDDPEPEPIAGPSVARPASKLSGVRKKLPLGTRPDSVAEAAPEAPASRLGKAGGPGMRRPGPIATSFKAAAVAQPSPIALNYALTGTQPEARKARLGKDTTRWINEGGTTRKDLAELLQSQMESHSSRDLISQLFSHDHNAVNDHIAGLNTLCELYNSAIDGDETLQAICLANLDLPLKYISIKAHEPQSNLISKCLDTVETVIAFLQHVGYQLTDNEATCFIPTMVFKLGDAREQVRGRIQQIIQSLAKVYAYSRLFGFLLEYGPKSKVAKTRQGALDEMAGLLKKSGMGVCDPPKAFPQIATMISDKDPQVRKSALLVLSEAYTFIGDKLWSFVGPLPQKEKTQLEERLRRVSGPAQTQETLAPPQVTRLAGGIPRPGSPAGTSRFGAIPRPGSPSVAGPSRLARPASPAAAAPSFPRPASPSRLQPPNNPTSPTGIGRPKSLLPGPSRLAKPRSNFSLAAAARADPAPQPTNGHVPSHLSHPVPVEEEEEPVPANGPEDITITISSILSSDASRSVDALKKIQKILAIGPNEGPSSVQYRELAEHTEGLIETITLQMAHIFERPDDLLADENFRLAKHLIQTLNTFCDHAFLAESLTVDILTSLLEELTLRLLETDDSPVKKVKDLSRFINMIILRLFATGRRMSIFRALFNLLLQIVKPFPSNGTDTSSKEAKVAELVLKCVWKLARSIPQDLTEQKLDPVELFPAVEHFLQSVPPNEWRARATNKVPCGDMPLRTIKVIIQHVVAHYSDDVYDLLSASFEDPSATIVYPYVYRILNSQAKNAELAVATDLGRRPVSPVSSRPISPQETIASSAPSIHRRDSPATSHHSSPSMNGQFSHAMEEPDPDAKLLTIIGHISSETTGALHKEGITELHQFLKAYPHKRPRVEKMLDATGAAFRKYINRALATRAAEDLERGVGGGDTAAGQEVEIPASVGASEPMSPRSPRSAVFPENPAAEEKLSRLHDIFHYRSSTLSNGSSSRRTSLS